jgi:hypothetical protein
MSVVLAHMVAAACSLAGVYLLFHRTGFSECVYTSISDFGLLVYMCGAVVKLFLKTVNQNVSVAILLLLLLLLLSVLRWL